MNNKLKQKIISITKELANVPIGKNRHFSFFVRRNTIISIGWNDYFGTHPYCKRYGYDKKRIHSELAALIKFRGNYSDLRKCTIINSRVNRFLDIGMSKPCEVCSRLIKEIGFKKVYYSNIDGEFVKL